MRQARAWHVNFDWWDEDSPLFPVTLIVVANDDKQAMKTARETVETLAQRLGSESFDPNDVHVYLDALGPCVIAD